MKDIYEIRPHHGMCISYFRGKGYCPEFTIHMKEMINCFQGNPEVRLVMHSDEICIACPNRINDGCNADEKVLRYDQGVLDACHLETETVLPVKDFFAQVKKEILQTGKRKDICGDCAWNEICEKIETKGDY